MATDTKYECGDSIDHEIRENSKKRAKGEVRQKSKRITSELMARQNQWNRERRMWRKLRCNFNPCDVYITLEFSTGTKIDGKATRKILRKFFRNLRGAYRRRGYVLKFIARAEIGERGGMHIHLVVNVIDGLITTKKLVEKIWGKHGGEVYAKCLYDEGKYKQLASYFVKPVADEVEDYLEELEECERDIFERYTCSRNLIMPEPKHEKCSSRDIDDMMRNGITPTPGYYVDMDSVRYGENQYTGARYLYYTEFKLEEPEFISRNRRI